MDKSSVIQISRGLAILLVVLHHVGNVFEIPEMLSNVLSLINRVHVVVFFVITGWLFEMKKSSYLCNGFWKYVGNKFCQLYVPYFCFSFLFSMLVILAGKVEKLHGVVLSLSGGRSKGFFESIKDILLFKNVYFESLWFIYIMFIFMVLMYLLADEKYVNIKIVQGVLLVSAICKALFFYELISYPVLNDFISYIGWVLLGRLLYIHKGFISYISTGKFVVRFCVLIALFIIMRTCFIDITGIGTVLSRSVYIQLEIFLFRFSLLYLIYRFSKRVKEFKLGRVLKFFGDRSYELYLVHNPWFVSTVGFVMSRVVGYRIGVLVSFILVIVLSLIVIWVIEKYFNRISKVLFGRLRV